MMECSINQMSIGDLVFCATLGYILASVLIVVGSAMLWEMYKSFGLDIPDVIMAVILKVLGWTFVVYMTINLIIC